MRYINGTRLDDRIVRTDWDAGFIEGRQYGRGRSGGQVSLFEPHCYVLSVFHAFNPASSGLGHLTFLQHFPS